MCRRAQVCFGFFHLTYVIHGVNSLSGLGICLWFVQGKSHWNNLVSQNIDREINMKTGCCIC